jgi:hypothetical protein
MPTWLIIVLLVLAVLAVGGFFARRALNRRTEADFRKRLTRADEDLAAAAAADRGWDRDTLETAARRIHAEQRGTEPATLHLIEVVDRPGTEQDLAVFRVEAEGRKGTLTLGRRDGDWVLDSLR